MAMQLSIDEKNRHGQPRGEEITRGAAVVWIFAQMQAMANLLGRVAAHGFERLKSAQSRGNKRKQMQLVESLALGNRRQLLLVVCDNQRYLVGAGADSVGSILAMEAGTASRDRAAKGPELVRRQEREAAHEARLRAASEPAFGVGPDLWH